MAVDVTAAPAFEANRLTWPTLRELHRFRICVVEPRNYACTLHEAIFQSTLVHLLSPPQELVDPFATQTGPPRPVPERFDLVTFPEAFLPVDAFVECLRGLGQQPPQPSLMGCVHVGLRPTADRGEAHLFEQTEVAKLVRDLRTNERIVADDLVRFEQWVSSRPPTERFNIGCLFTVDPERQIRVCLHPKLVRSIYEASPIAEEHMAEAHLLSLVTLRPRDQHLPTTTIQPILCSDAFSDVSDRHGGGGMGAIASHPECLGDAPPDRVDLVSLATCTPAGERRAGIEGDTIRFEWKKAFRDAFVAAWKDGRFHRHRDAAFLLSNYLWFPLNENAVRPAGLSGVFLPLPPYTEVFPDFVAVAVYGRTGKSEHDEEDWMTHENYRDIARKEPTLGHGVSIRRDDGRPDAGAATIMRLDIQRLPCEASRWNRDGKLVDLRLFDVVPMLEPDAQGTRPRFHVVPRAPT